MSDTVMPSHTKLWSRPLFFMLKVMEMLSCDCKRTCIAGECPCIDNALPCTNACKLKDCNNMVDDSDSEGCSTD